MSHQTQHRLAVNMIVKPIMPCCKNRLGGQKARGNHLISFFTLIWLVWVGCPGLPAWADEFLPNQWWINGAFYGDDIRTHFGDVNGDGKVDAVVSSGVVKVRLSDGTGFQAAQDWNTIGFTGVYATDFVDVTGDGLADAVVSGDAGIVVRRSDGTQFLPNEFWSTTRFVGFDGITYFADVTGDGRADAVIAHHVGILVRPSTGDAFEPARAWTEIGYSGIHATAFVDVTGDGLADAVASGDDGIAVRRSDGSQFLPNEFWSSYGFFGADGRTYLADVNGDGRADAVVSYDHAVTVRYSNGSSFLPGENWTNMGYFGTYATTYTDVTGDGRADAVVSVDSGVVVRPSYSRAGYARSDDIGYRPGAWMAQIPDQVRLSGLSLPGTHDTGAFNFGGDSVMAQSMNYKTQLESGIRAWDIRLKWFPAPSFREPSSGCSFLKPWNCFVALAEEVVELGEALVELAEDPEALMTWIEGEVGGTDQYLGWLADRVGDINSIFWSLHVSHSEFYQGAPWMTYSMPPTNF